MTNNTNLPTLDNAHLDRIERFQSLQSAQFWRATQSIIHEGIDEGMVLLIESIRWVDEAPHTIILRSHPDRIGQTITIQVPQENGPDRPTRFAYGHHKFLLKEFLLAFEYEPDYQCIRDEELQAIQRRINVKVHDSTAADPSLDHWYQNWKVRTLGYAKTWESAQLLDNNNRLCIDSMSNHRQSIIH
jgi:hypothetical protein